MYEADEAFCFPRAAVEKAHRAVKLSGASDRQKKIKYNTQRFFNSVAAILLAVALDMLFTILKFDSKLCTCSKAHCVHQDLTRETHAKLLKPNALNTFRI